MIDYKQSTKNISGKWLRARHADSPFRGQNCPTVATRE